MEPQTTAQSNKRVVVMLVLLVILLGGTSGYLYKKTLAQKNTPEQVAQEEAQTLAKKVGMLIVLPTDETPTVATVSDPEALKNQAFFENAKVGDKVLIYTNAKKAVLYDPTLNKILNVAPLNIGDGKAIAPKTNTETSTTPPATTSN